MKIKMTEEIFLKLYFLIGVLSAPVCSEVWTASVTENLEALVSSCVVVPCSFSHPKERLPTSRLRGQWHQTKDKNQLIYYEDNTRVVENFRGRTRLLGELGKGNCTLEIKEIKDHDNGPFCFRIELARTEKDTNTVDKYSFVEDCVTLNMLSSPKDPSLIFKDPVEGRPFSISCFITHTCPTFKPKLQWSRTGDEIAESHREIHRGVWEVNSVLTFIPAEKDDHKEVTCTAHFEGGKMSTKKMKLYVERMKNYNHIIIPVTVAIGLAAIFGGLCFLMVKKYKSSLAIDHILYKPQNNCETKRSKPCFPSPESKPKGCSFNEDDGDDYMNTADLNVYGRDVQTFSIKNYISKYR